MNYKSKLDRFTQEKQSYSDSIFSKQLKIWRRSGSNIFRDKYQTVSQYIDWLKKLVIGIRVSATDWAVIHVIYFLCCSTNLAFAGSYQLVKGSGIKVCEAYKINLEPRNDPQSMACERQYNSSIPGFSIPIWHQLDIKKNIPLFRRAITYSIENDDSPYGMKLSDEEARERVNDIINSGYYLKSELFETKVNLFGNKNPVTVLSVRDSCDEKISGNTKRSSLFILKDKKPVIDTARQSGLGGPLNNATLVEYEGSVYIEEYQPDDNWAHILTGISHLYVFSAAAENPGIKCQVDFIPSVKSVN